MPDPKLSVILPNYNHAEFLPRSLDSSLGQSFSDFELIVIDDCSTDDSYEILQEYARRDSRIQLHRNERNLGVVATLNRALGRARGEFVHGASSDDYILPGYYEAAMSMFSKHPQAAICLGKTRVVNGRGITTDVVPGEWASERTYLSPAELSGRMNSCGVPGPAIWRRELFLAAGGYLPELRWHSDWFALQVIAYRHGLCFLPEIVSVVRSVDDSYSNNASFEIDQQREVLQCLLRKFQCPDYRDVVPLLAKSGILRQFGFPLLYASVTLDGGFEGLIELLKPLVLPSVKLLIRNPSASIRIGAANFLGRCGAEGLAFDRQLAELLKDSSPEVAEAARTSLDAVRRSVSHKTLLRHRIRRAIGPIIRRFDRAMRPLVHDRLEEQERMLTDILAVQGETQHLIRNLRDSLNFALKELAGSASGEARKAVRKVEIQKVP